MKAIIKETGEKIDVTVLKKVSYITENGEIYFGDDLEIDAPKIDINGITYFASPEIFESSCVGCDLDVFGCDCECNKFKQYFDSGTILIKDKIK